MNQSNKEKIRLLIDSGVHTLLKETPNVMLNIKKKSNESDMSLSIKNLKEINSIADLTLFMHSQNSTLKKLNNFVVFDGNLNSKLMIIGDAPTEEDQQNEKLFSGNAGQLLDKMIGAIDLKRDNIYITNVIPWCMTERRAPSETEILEFLPFLQRQIEIIKPSFIYLLGQTATKAILSSPISLDKLRGKWYEYKSINLDKSVNVIASYHPDFLLSSPKYKKEAWNDLQMLKKKINE